MSLNTYYGTFGRNKENESREHLVQVEQEETEQPQNNAQQAVLIFGFSKTTVYFSFFVLIYLLFLTCGAMTFGYLEKPTETALRVELESSKQSFLRKFPGVTSRFLVFKNHFWIYV